MRFHILLVLSASLGLVSCQNEGQLEERAPYQAKSTSKALSTSTVKSTSTSTSSVKSTSTTSVKSTSISSITSTSTSSTKPSSTTSTSILTTSTSVPTLTQPSAVSTSIVTTLTPPESSAVQQCQPQITNAQTQPQCGIAGGSLISAYFQTNQSSFTVLSQCGALCKSQFLCQSYAVQDGSCRLYFLPVTAVIQQKLKGNNTLYDRGCATSTDICQVNGWRTSYDKSFANSTKLQDNNFKGCQKLCLAASGCSAFSIQLGLGGACQLYKNALYKDFLPQSSSLNIYWDINCPRDVPGAINPAPTLTPYVPPTTVPTIANETQVMFPVFTAPSPLVTNDPPYTPTGPQPTPDDDNIFVQTYTYTQFQLPDVVATGTAPDTIGLIQPTGTALPSAPCLVSAGPAAQFTVINENFIPMVSRTGSVGPLLQPTVAPAANDPILNPETLVLPPFYFQSASGSNAYDLVYAGSSSPLYVAMHSNGSVLLTSASTGTSFVNNLVTSIFSFDCYGRITVTQGGSSYNWVTNAAVSSFVQGANTNNMKALPVNIPTIQSARKNRKRNLELGKKLRERSDTDGPAPKCPNSPPGLHALTKQGYQQGQGNFCDNLDDTWQLSPYDFDGSCAVQSACYDSCEYFDWQSCNGIFGTMMIASCWAEFDDWWEVISAIACTVQASYFTGVAATSTGRDLFYKAQNAMCACFCSSPPDTCANADRSIFYCADLQHGQDNNNCGACGRICGPNSACRDGGVCGCPTDQCGSTCLDFRNNPNNCGSCGNVCDPSYCVGGQCYAPKPGQCAPDQGVQNQDFAVWTPNVVNWTTAAYPGCTLADNIDFFPATYTGVNGQSIGCVGISMTNLPGSGCQAALTAVQAKMCPGLSYELTFVMGAVNQIDGVDVNDDADCTVRWLTGPPDAPGNSDNFQSSQSYTIQGNSQTFQTFGPWSLSVAQGDPGVEFHHGNLYVNLTAVLSCSGGGRGNFILSEVLLNPVGSSKARSLTIDGEEVKPQIWTRQANSTSSFNISQALQPYTPASTAVVALTFSQ